MNDPSHVPRGREQDVGPPPQVEPSGSLQNTPTVEFRKQLGARNPLPIDAELSETPSPVDPTVCAIPSPTQVEVPPELANHARYRVVGMLGKGGMGIVYQAEHRIMKRAVALKVIGAHLVAHPAALARFRREVEAAAKLSHPNIVTAYDAEQAGNCHFLVMELVDGINFDHLLQRQGPFPLDFACDCVRQAALGLQHAHEHGMVHRDIKLQNLMLTRKGQVKILDFGLARFASEKGPTASLTECGVLTGTPDFIAPEQAEDAHHADIRADIYSLGCTFYTLLTGQLPFPGRTHIEKLVGHLKKEPALLTAFRGDLPPELIHLVGRMMAKEPAHRFQTPDEVVKALLAFGEDGAATTAVCDAADDSIAQTPPSCAESVPTLEEAPSRRVARTSPARRRNCPTAHPGRGYLVIGAVLGMLGLLGLGGLLLLVMLQGRVGDKKARNALPPLSTGVWEQEQGQVRVLSRDPRVQLAVRRGPRVFGTIGPNSKPEMSLPPGEYEVQVVDGAPELRGITARLSVARGDRKVVEVRREGVFVRDFPAGFPPPPPPPPPPGHHGGPPPPFGPPPRP